MLQSLWDDFMGVEIDTPPKKVGLTVTEAALEKIASMCLENNMEAVRPYVHGGGCSGMNYTLNFTDREPNEQDQVIHFAKGTMKMLVPFSSYVYIMNTEIDYSDDLLNGGFKFGNPEANRTCGCGTSFSV